MSERVNTRTRHHCPADQRASQAPCSIRFSRPQDWLVCIWRTKADRTPASPGAHRHASKAATGSFLPAQWAAHADALTVPTGDVVLVPRSAIHQRPHAVQGSWGSARRTWSSKADPSAALHPFVRPQVSRAHPSNHPGATAKGGRGTSRTPPIPSGTNIRAPSGAKRSPGSATDRTRRPAGSHDATRSPVSSAHASTPPPAFSTRNHRPSGLTSNPGHANPPAPPVSTAFPTCRPEAASQAVTMTPSRASTRRPPEA